MLAMRARTHRTTNVKTYYYLKLADKIKAGDEWYNPSTGQWVAARAIGSVVMPLEVGEYRRPIYEAVATHRAAQ